MSVAINTTVVDHEKRCILSVKKPIVLEDEARIDCPIVVHPSGNCLLDGEDIHPKTWKCTTLCKTPNDADKIKIFQLKTEFENPVEQIRLLLESIDTECPHGHYFRKGVIDTETFVEVDEHAKVDVCDDNNMSIKDDSGLENMLFEDNDTATEAFYCSGDENGDHDHAAMFLHSLEEDSSDDDHFISCHHEDVSVYGSDDDHNKSNSEIDARDKKI